MSAYAIRKIGTVTAEESDEMALAITQDVQDYFKGFRLQEIVQAIQDGAKGMYEQEGDMTTVSVELILKWIRRYAESVRKEALHKQRVHEEKLEEAKTEQKRIAGERMIDSAINELYELYLMDYDIFEVVREKTPAPTSLLACWYRHLDSKGLVEISKEDKIIIFGLAEEKIESSVPSKEEAKEFQIYNQTKKTQIKELAQSMALKEIFFSFKEQGKTTVFEL